MITFEDGTQLPAENWSRIMAVIQQRAKDGKPAPTKIQQGSVTIKLDGLKVKKDAKIKPGQGPEYAKYLQSTYKDWKIRVWKMKKEQVYGVNYFQGEDIRYMEVPVGDVLDENGVFKYVQCFVDDIVG